MRRLHFCKSFSKVVDLENLGFLLGLHSSAFYKKQEDLSNAQRLPPPETIRLGIDCTVKRLTSPEEHVLLRDEEVPQRWKSQDERIRDVMDMRRARDEFYQQSEE